MKQMKRALAIILAVMMLIGMVPVASMAAPQFTRLGNSNIGYYLDEDGTLTLRGRGSTPDFHDGSSPFDFRYDNDLSCPYLIKRLLLLKGFYEFLLSNQFFCAFHFIIFTYYGNSMSHRNHITDKLR